MKTWEYKIINVRSENYSMDPRRAEELNRLGDDGWSWSASPRSTSRPVRPITSAWSSNVRSSTHPA